MHRLTAVLSAMISAGCLGGVLSPVSAAVQWAPASSAIIHPGVQLFTNGAQCTANFIFTNGAHVYVGQAAHCSGTGLNGVTDGCSSPSLALGTPVGIPGARRPGRIVYSSWLTMQAVHETDPDACQYNDLALVELDPADVGSVNPSIPVWGGPVGISTGGTSPSDPIYGYGHSELAMGLSLLGSKQGVSLGDSGRGWSHRVLTASPGIPGDSGSAYLDSQGRALGILSTLDLAPVPGSNGVGDLSRELAYLHAHTPLGSVQLAFGTKPFTANRLGVASA
ncbi:MAG: hypothetical protein QOE72_4982 [Chloroflexota bacterium]|nr:hypothetical protein [Chloroflexota bacterium]